MGFRFLSGAGGEFCTADGLNDGPGAAPDSEGFWFGGYGHSGDGNSRFARGRRAFGGLCAARVHHLRANLDSVLDSTWPWEACLPCFV